MEKDENRRMTGEQDLPRVVAPSMQSSLETSLARVGRAGRLPRGVAGGLLAAGVAGLVGAFTLDVRHAVLVAGSILIGTLLGTFVGRWLLRRWW